MFRYIRAMPRGDKDIENRIADAAEQIDEHLIKLILYPNNTQDIEHWRSEIYAFLHKVDKRKTANKYPKSRFIYNALACHNDIMDNIIRCVKSEYAYTPKYISNPEILEIIEKYQKWLAYELSSQGAVTKQEVTQCLQSLGL